MCAPEINYSYILAIKCDHGALKSCISWHELRALLRGGSENSLKQLVCTVVSCGMMSCFKVILIALSVSVMFILILTLNNIRTVYQSIICHFIHLHWRTQWSLD